MVDNILPSSYRRWYSGTICQPQSCNHVSSVSSWKLPVIHWFLLLLGLTERWRHWFKFESYLFACNMNLWYTEATRFNKQVRLCQVLYIFLWIYNAFCKSNVWKPKMCVMSLQRTMFPYISLLYDSGMWQYGSTKWYLHSKTLNMANVENKSTEENNV